MFTIIYEKETGAVINVTSGRGDEDALRQAIDNERKDYIFVEELPEMQNYRRQYLKVEDGNLILANREFDEEGEKFVQELEAYDEIAEHREWFNTLYTKNEQKYNRLVFLGKQCDDGTDAKDALLDLYNEAETRRIRIQELERKVENLRGVK